MDSELQTPVPMHKISTVSMRRSSLMLDNTSQYGDVIVEPLVSPQVLHLGHYPNDSSAIDKVKRILESDDEHCIPRRPLFCEMLYYDEQTQDAEQEVFFWKECSRWVKFEETVEEGGTRWSKPHITLLTIQSLLQIRNCLNKGGTLFDVNAESFSELVELICTSWTKRNHLSTNDVQVVRNILNSPKKHLVRNKLRVTGKVPFDETLMVDINGDTITKSESTYPKPELRTPTSKNLQNIFHRKGASTDEPNADGSAQQPAPNAPKTGKINQSLFRKIPEDAEAVCIFVGFVDGLKYAVTEFVRLKQAKVFAEITELPVPTRFVFVLLLPTEHDELDGHLIGRTLGALMVDEVFSKVAYKARNGAELSFAVEEFLEQSTIMPAGKWNPVCRWEPPENQPVVSRTITETLNLQTFHHAEDPEEEGKLKRTGKLFGGLVEDVKLKAFWYKSDYVDAFRGRITQTLAAAIFLFFANISKIITFGGVMDHVLHQKIGAIENVLAGGICGVIYAIFSGQPLCVLSATGPCLVFEVILYDLCEKMALDFFVVRAWVGFWTAIFLVILVATDASVVVGMITRFTEEAFATLISLIFLVKAFDELMEITHENPVTFDIKRVLKGACNCTFADSIDLNITNITTYSSYSNYTGKECKKSHGTPEGSQCYFNPDVFMFSIILMVSTFFISIALKVFRHSSFGTSKIRNVIADFNAIIAICIMTGVNYFVGLDVPCLNVPGEFQPTTADRSWFINPFVFGQYWWITVATILPAAFFSVLVMMDQNITVVIINRPDNKLKKGYGYHLDLLVIAFLMIVCSVLAIPFYVAATVISLMHVDSLRVMSQTAAPGEKPHFLGIREQRVTALVAHILIGLSVFLTPVMKLIPMPVLLGVFLYIGIVSLAGQQFVQRILILFMPMKHQPDYPWLRLVRMKRVHLFTAVQLISFLFLLIIEENKTISMIFPLMLVIMVFIRKVVMERIFTHKELCALDDPLPSWREMLRAKKTNYDVNVVVAEESLQLQKNS